MVCDFYATTSMSHFAGVYIDFKLPEESLFAAGKLTQTELELPVRN